MFVDTFDAQLERRDRPRRERRLEQVGEVAANFLRADQIQLARVAARGRRESRKIDLVEIIAGVIPLAAPVDVRRYL